MTPKDLYIKGVASGGGGSSISTATLMKTGQVTSFRTGDDGDVQAGRDVGFFVLAENNPFGHAFRFCGTTGGYTDGSNYYTVNGVLTTKVSAFPNNIMLDFSTNNGESIIIYKYTGLNYNWNDSIDYALIITDLGLSGWRLPNIREGASLINYEIGMDYGITFGLGSTFFWSSTTCYRVTTHAISFTGWTAECAIFAKTTVLYVLACRTTLLTELGL